MLEKLRYGYTTTAHRHSLLYHVFHVPARLRLLYDTAFVLTDTCAPNVFPTSSSRHRGAPRAPNNTERHHQHVAEAGTKRGVLNTRSGPDQIAQELRGGLLRSDELMYSSPQSEGTVKPSEQRQVTPLDARSQTADFGVIAVAFSCVQVVP